MLHHRITTLGCFILFGAINLWAQSNLIRNSSFEPDWFYDHFPRSGENLFDRCPMHWMDFNPGDNERWYLDSIWAGNPNLPNPDFQHGYFYSQFTNIGAPWERDTTPGATPLQSANTGTGFVGIDLKSDLFTREGIQTQIQDCPLNSGLYFASTWFSRTYPSTDLEFHLYLSDQSSTRKKKIADHSFSVQGAPAGQWFLASHPFSIDINDPDEQALNWFSITGGTSVSSSYGEYTYFDDVRLYRPCDDLLRCNRTHGQICPTIATMLPPDDLLAVRDIDNVLDVHLVISNTLQQSLLDTTWHNANGFTEFRLARTNLPAQMATGNYPYTLTLSNDCGATKHGGTIRVADTALYNLTPPWTDSTASWSPTPIPCCLDSLLLRNLTLRGNISYIVRDQITVQDGVSIAPGSNVLLQAGNVVEIDSAEFDGSVSSLEILEIPCPQRCAQGQDCGGGLATIDAGGFVLPPLDSASMAQEEVELPSQASLKTQIGAEASGTGIPLLSISPNPVHETARIDVQVSEGTTVTLTIYDLQQRLVRSIATDIALTIGSHRFDVQMLAVPPGIYIVQLRTENATIQRRLVKL